MRLAAFSHSISASREWSLPSRWLPELDLVAFRVHDPSELPVLRVVCFFKHVAAFFAQCLKQGGQVLDPIVDHEGRLAWSEVIAVCCADGPDRGSLSRVSRGIGPGEGRTTPVLDINPQ